jgi:acyl-CoA oxidase
MFSAQINGVNIFDAWMMQESELVQQLATSYGENLALEQFNLALEKAKLFRSEKTLRKLFVLYALDRILEYGVFYLTNGFVTAEQIEQVQSEIKQLCSELGKQALDLTRAFGIPDHLHFAPIANDWLKYNTFENSGELVKFFQAGKGVQSKL